jgi:hypothetical protein
MKTSIQLIVTVNVESSKLTLADMDTVRGACGRAVETALHEGLNHGLDASMTLDSVRPITVHYTKVAKKKGRQ